MEEGAEKQEIQKKQVERRLLGNNFLFCLQNTTCSVCKVGRIGGRRRDEAAAKDGYHERSDKENQIIRKDGCQNRWWAELLAKACEKAWTHTGWEGTMQRWYEWLEYMKKKDEKEKMEEMHQRKVEKMIKSAEGSAGLLHKITKPTMWRGGVQILKEEEKDARLLDRCEGKRKEWAKHWQCDEEMRNVQNKPWRNEKLQECEEALPRLKESDLDKASRLCKAKQE